MEAVMKSGWRRSPQRRPQLRLFILDRRPDGKVLAIAVDGGDEGGQRSQILDLQNADASCLDLTTNDLATTPELLSTHSETALVHRIRPQPGEEPEMICKEKKGKTELSKIGGWTQERFGVATDG
ncbi:hypothetical protein Bca4012_086058 [Brassica carinata]